MGFLAEALTSLTMRRESSLHLTRLTQIQCQISSVALSWTDTIQSIRINDVRGEGSVNGSGVNTCPRTKDR